MLFTTPPQKKTKTWHHLPLQWTVIVDRQVWSTTWLCSWPTLSSIVKTATDSLTHSYVTFDFLSKTQNYTFECLGGTLTSFGSVLHSIDCAGILKLRNADIELKKGETDIGRKNTRVRIVFRVAVPQPDGQMLWLQTTSVPVECCELALNWARHISFEVSRTWWSKPD